MSDNQGRGAHMKKKTREGAPTGVTTREEERGVNSGPEHYRTPTHTHPAPARLSRHTRRRVGGTPSPSPSTSAQRPTVNKARPVGSQSMNAALSQPESPPRGGPVAQDELVAPEGHARLSCSN